MNKNNRDTTSATSGIQQKTFLKAARPAKRPIQKAASMVPPTTETKKKDAVKKKPNAAATADQEEQPSPMKRKKCTVVLK